MGTSDDRNGQTHEDGTVPSAPKPYSDQVVCGEQWQPQVAQVDPTQRRRVVVFPTTDEDRLRKYTESLKNSILKSVEQDCSSSSSSSSCSSSSSSSDCESSDCGEMVFAPETVVPPVAIAAAQNPRRSFREADVKVNSHRTPREEVKKRASREDINPSSRAPREIGKSGAAREDRPKKLSREEIEHLQQPQPHRNGGRPRLTRDESAKQSELEKRKSSRCDPTTIMIGDDMIVDSGNNPQKDKQEQKQEQKQQQPPPVHQQPQKKHQKPESYKMGRSNGDERKAPARKRDEVTEDAEAKRKKKKKKRDEEVSATKGKSLTDREKIMRKLLEDMNEVEALQKKLEKTRKNVKETRNEKGDGETRDDKQKKKKKKNRDPRKRREERIDELAMKPDVKTESDRPAQRGRRKR